MTNIISAENNDRKILELKKDLENVKTFAELKEIIKQTGEEIDRLISTLKQRNTGA